MALPFVLALLTGCDPHDATVTGEYAIYFAQATSDNLVRLHDAYNVDDCDYTQTDPLSDSIDTDQIFKDECWTKKVEAEKKFQDDYKLTPLDCRYYGSKPYNGNAIRTRDTIIPGWEEEYEAQCCVESFDDDPDNDPDGSLFTPREKDENGRDTGPYNPDCTLRSADYMRWLDDKAYYLNTGKVTTYREEALITAEGDLQLTVHMNTPFGDVRFGWVVKPDYDPQQCATVDGKVTNEPLFGDADVLKNWSADEDGKTLFNINAGTYQVNPFKGDDYWYFDPKWAAASGFSRFGDEDAYVYSTDYQEYLDDQGVYVPFWVSTNDDGRITGGYGEATNASFHELNCGANDDTCNLKDYPDFVQMMKDNFINGGTDEDGNEVEPVNNELQNFGRLSRDDFPLDIKIEDNSWRVTAPGKGDDAAGLDNWVGVNASWVRFDADIDTLKGLQPGAQDKPLKGDFQLYLTSAATSGSVWFFHGTFEIDTIERDTWGYSPELDELKRDENDTTECGG